MTAAHRKDTPFMDIADFLAWEGEEPGMKYELIDGVPRAMAPGSDTHNTIVMNIGYLLSAALRRSRPDCRAIVAPGVQTRVRASWNFRIPDLGVACAPTRSGDVMTPEPILLVEVLSPGNARETWENVVAYTTLPSLREILVVHSTRVKAELLTRDSAGAWPADPTPLGPGETVALAAIDAAFPLEEAYAGTYLAPQETLR